MDEDANAKESHKDLTLIKKCCQESVSDYFNISSAWRVSARFSLISPQMGHCACYTLVRQMRNCVWN